MSNYSTENLRTLALVGHGSCGKTSLIEAMLYRSGMIPELGSVERGNTMCDNDALEKEVGHSIRLAVAHVDTAMADLTPVRIHILDTPGYPDYLGQDLSALDAVKSVCAVIDPTRGPELLTRRMMEAAKERGLCRMIVCRMPILRSVWKNCVKRGVRAYCRSTFRLATARTSSTASIARTATATS